MSHRYRSSCCCDSPDTLGTCFTGFGAVPKTGLNVDNCNSVHTEFNRFDNWEVCGHDNQEELLVKIDRSPWVADSVVGVYPVDVCVSCSSCPSQNIGYGAFGEVPIYTWYASWSSRKIQDEPGANLADFYDGGTSPSDEQVYTWYHTSDILQGLRLPGGDGYPDSSKYKGGLNLYTLPLIPNPRDLENAHPVALPPGSEAPCCCHSFRDSLSGCPDVLCRRDFFSFCAQAPNLLIQPFGSVLSTPIPITEGQFQLVGDYLDVDRWRTSNYGWLRSQQHKESGCNRKTKECLHGGNYFWLQDIIAQSTFAGVDKYYPHWEVSLGSEGGASINQIYSFGECGATPSDAQAPYQGWPLGRTLISVFHKEKWYQRYWSSIDENDVCPPGDPNCGSCVLDDDFNCVDPNFSSTTLDIYPGHFAACRTPKFIGFACAGIPVFSHEIMTNTRLLGTEPPDNIYTDVYRPENAAEYIMFACKFDLPIPSYITAIMEEEEILPDPNPNLTETDGEEVAYRIFKKPLRHLGGSDGQVDKGRCCVNIDDIPNQIIPPFENCGVLSSDRPEGELECGCIDPECTLWSIPTWDEELAGIPKDQATQAQLADISNYSCFGGEVTGNDCYCLGCGQKELFGIEGDSWNEDCLGLIYTLGSTYCFPSTLCIPNISEFACEIGFGGQYTPGTDFGSGCTMQDDQGNELASCDDLRNDAIIGSCCFYKAGTLGPGDPEGSPIHCLEMSEQACANVLTPGGFGINPCAFSDTQDGCIDSIKCTELTNTSPGYLLDWCDGLERLQSLFDENQISRLTTSWTALRNCQPVEDVNEGPDGELNECTFQCTSESSELGDCFDELDLIFPNGPGDPCQVGYTTEYEYFYGRPGGWTWVCPGDMNQINGENFPQVPRLGSGCGCQTPACDPLSSDSPQQCGSVGGPNESCNVSPGGGPGCFSAGPYPQATYSSPLRQCCCGCETSGYNRGFADPGEFGPIGGGGGVGEGGGHGGGEGPVEGPGDVDPEIDLDPGDDGDSGVDPEGGSEDPPGEGPEGPVQGPGQGPTIIINPDSPIDGGDPGDPSDPPVDPVDPPIVQPVGCRTDADCATGDPCYVGRCIDGRCVREFNPNCGDDPASCPPPCDECECNDCGLYGEATFPPEAACPPGTVPCRPPLLTICGSGCNDLGDDFGGAACQPADSGVGSIGVESQDFCTNMAISQTCDGAWFKQIHAGFRYDPNSQNPNGVGYDCQYENNAFFLRVPCPDKNEEEWGGPACKEYCAEYDISWEEVVIDGSGGEVSYIPSINGVTIDVNGEGTPAGGVNVSIEFYSGCIHSIYQRDSSNANPKFANCIRFETVNGDPVDNNLLQYGCPPETGECVDGINGGCGSPGCYLDNSCDLVFGRDKETQVTASTPPEGVIEPSQRVNMVLTVTPPDEENDIEIRIPATVILNPNKNPHTNISGLGDYQWYHLPINRHKANSSRGFAQGDCCPCCGSELSISQSSGGAGGLCERREGQKDGSSEGGPKCGFIRKPSSGEDIPDPRCGNLCEPGYYCCPLTGQCLPDRGLPGEEGDDILYCEKCPVPCPEGENCCITYILGSDPPRYRPQCVVGECSDFDSTTTPPGNYTFSFENGVCPPGNSSPPNCEFRYNTPITIIAELI